MSFLPPSAALCVLAIRITLPLTKLLLASSRLAVSTGNLTLVAYGRFSAILASLGQSSKLGCHSSTEARAATSAKPTVRSWQWRLPEASWTFV